MMISRPDLVHLDRATSESGADQARQKLPENIYTGIWWYTRFPFHYSGDGSPANKELGEFQMKWWIDSVVKAIKAVKADDVSLKMQKEFLREEHASAGYSTVETQLAASACHETKLASVLSNQHAGEKHQHAAQPHLQCRESSMAYPCSACRIHVITASSASTTARGPQRRPKIADQRNGSVCPIPPTAVIAPQISPRTHGCPRPVRLPSSDRRLGKPHADACARRGGEARPETRPSFFASRTRPQTRAPKSIPIRPSIPPGPAAQSAARTAAAAPPLRRPSHCPAASACRVPGRVLRARALPFARSSSNCRMLASCVRAAAFS